jgi:hypothetical protein
MNAPRDKPVRPEAPDPSDCCGGGCVRCVFDVYDEQMAEWRAACARVEADPAAEGHPEPGANRD